MAGGATQQSLRRALGALKDTTKVGLAKVNSEYKDLDVAIVKATSHVECPPKEKHVRTIFAATSASRPRADVVYCIQALARRLAKTHTWTVALKSLIIIHRSLREGDPTFREELSNYTRSKEPILNLSNFKDDSSPNAWDYSAWVRTYALFLEERMECFRMLKYDVESEPMSKARSKTRDLDTEDLLEQLPALQQFLYRLVGCQPEGAAMSNFVIQYALGLVLKESFKLYCAINDGIINLVDKFFEMQRHDAVKALDIYKRAGQQAERLSEFYEACRRLEIARSFQFPTLAQPPQSFLTTMEDYVKDAPRLVPVPRDFLEYNDEKAVVPRLQITYHEKEDETEPETAPPPAAASFSFPKEIPPGPPSQTSDLLGLAEANLDHSAWEESNALALAIVPSGPVSNGNPASFDQSSGLNLSVGATGWELALVTTPSSNGSAVNNSRLAGGLDKLTLDSLYEDALMRHSSHMPSGSNNPFDAGPVLQPGQHDPFFASSKFAPPPNVQMAAMAQQQQALMLQQQQMMQVKPGENPFGNPYGMNHPYDTGPTAQNQYQHNPFGNPGLL